MVQHYGLIGKKLSHSFSKLYFTEKFQREGLKNCSYHLFELSEVEELPRLISDQAALKGLNVTIPYKEAIIPYLDEIDPVAKDIGAVNVISIKDGQLKGYNSDFYGFRDSLKRWITPQKPLKALVLGTGGASKAVTSVLKSMSIPFLLVSRQQSNNILSYEQLKLQPDLLMTHRLIINTTPLGMYPNIDSAPDITYSLLTKGHYLYDLVYNPEKTRFLELGQQQGTGIKNGLEMLTLQAEKSWEIWQAR